MTPLRPHLASPPIAGPWFAPRPTPETELPVETPVSEPPTVLGHQTAAPDWVERVWALAQAAAAAGPVSPAQRAALVAHAQAECRLAGALPYDPAAHAVDAWTDERRSVLVGRVADLEEQLDFAVVRTRERREELAGLGRVPTRPSRWGFGAVLLGVAGAGATVAMALQGMFVGFADTTLQQLVLGGGFAALMLSAIVVGEWNVAGLRRPGVAARNGALLPLAGVGAAAGFLLLRLGAGADPATAGGWALVELGILLVVGQLSAERGRSRVAWQAEQREWDEGVQQVAVAEAFEQQCAQDLQDAQQILLELEDGVRARTHWHGLGEHLEAAVLAGVEARLLGTAPQRPVGDEGPWLNK